MEERGAGDKEDLEVLRSFGTNVDSSGLIDCRSELVPDINADLLQDNSWHSFSTAVKSIS